LVWHDSTALCSGRSRWVSLVRITTHRTARPSGRGRMRASTNDGQGVRAPAR